MRTILLSALLSGIYAHPLGEDHNTKSSKEKRCGHSHCPLLPYPSGFNARTCPDATNGYNPFAIGLAVAPNKRSIIPTTTTTTTHTENADRLPLLQGRMNTCSEVAVTESVINFPGPIGNTAEIYLFANSRYTLTFDFDRVVKKVIAWAHHGPVYSQI